MSLPNSIISNPKIASWIHFEADGSIILKSGKVELGQGIATSLLQIAADELGVEIERIHLVAGNTSDAPNEGWTSASISIEVGGKAIQVVCSLVRSLCAHQAARQFAVDIRDILLSKGKFHSTDSEQTADYYSLSKAIDLGSSIVDLEKAGFNNTPWLAQQRYVGRSRLRIDLPEKISGKAFIHDFELSEMLHARVLRGPGYKSKLVSVDEHAIRALPGVQFFVRNGQFMAICGEDEALLVSSLAKAFDHVTWESGETQNLENFDQYLRNGVSSPEIVHNKNGDAPGNIVREFTASYTRPFLAHASIGTVCALAAFEKDQLHVWTQSQGVYPLRTCLAKFFGMPQECVHVVHMDGAGCYGHNGADDVALDASLIAAAIGKPVRVAWSRRDEFSAAPMGSAMSVDLHAGVDQENRIVAWCSDIFSLGHLIRPGWGETVNLLAALEIDEPFPEPAIKDPPMQPFGGGAARNAIPLYEFAAEKVTLNLVKEAPVRTSALRSLGAYANVFAIESFLDEIALELNEDPIDYRLSYLNDPRAAAVIETVIEKSAYRALQENTGERGLGFGFAQYKNNGAYFAIVVDLDLSEGIKVHRVYAAVDAGLVINPDGVKNQIEGGIIQAISWTLKEKMAFSEAGIQTASWEDYDICRFNEIPEEISIDILDADKNPSLGVGECAAGPTAAAIGNAIFNTLGVRIRHLPITYEKLAEALV